MSESDKVIKNDNSSGVIEIVDGVEISNDDIKEIQKHDELEKKATPTSVSTIVETDSISEQGTTRAAKVATPIAITSEKDLSEAVKLADPISPATAVPRNDVDPPNDDDSTKIIVNLVSSSHYNEEIQEQEKKIAQTQLEELEMHAARNKKKKIVTGESDSESSVKIEVKKTANAKIKGRSKTKKNKPIDNLENEDLVAILEGKDEGHYEIVSVAPEKSDKKINNGKSPDPLAEDLLVEGKTIKVEEVKKTRGRPKTNSKEQSGRLQTTLISSLTADWNEDSEKDLDTVSVQAVVEPKKSLTPPVKVKVEIVEETNTQSEPHKPRRVIKKKIIWDPDAPETHFPLASLVHSSTKQKLSPRESTKNPPIAEAATRHSATPKDNVPKSKVATDKLEEKVGTGTANVAGQKRQSQTPIILNNNKKKKLSETDKLLSDEGVSNMLSTLENDESNSKNVMKKRQVVLKKLTPSPTSTRKDVTSSPKKETVSAVTATTKRGETPILKKQNASSAVNQTTTTATTRKSKLTNSDDSAPLPKKRVPKPKKDNWDFVYNQKNIDSMIIRRRSSSYSSTTSPRRLSLEHVSPPKLPVTVSTMKTSNVTANKNQNTTSSTTAASKIKKEKVGGNGGFEFTKPGNKKSSDSGKKTTKKSSENEEKKINILEIKELGKIPLKNFELKNQIQTSLTETNNIKIQKFDNVTVLNVQLKANKVKHSFTIQILKDLTDMLNTLTNDDSCSVVVITSSGPYFCHGIDFSSVLYVNAERRKNASQVLARAVSNYLKALVCFPKPLIAGVQGICSGLGVTMLPLFDVVISKKENTFKTMYARIGQIPEGFCVLSQTNSVRHNFKTKLLWLCEEITSTEAVLSGLVTKATEPDKVEEDTIACAKKIASFSLQTFKSMKLQRFNNELSKLLETIDDEEKILVAHWSSIECQEKFKSYLQSEQW